MPDGLGLAAVLGGLDPPVHAGGTPIGPAPFDSRAERLRRGLACAVVDASVPLGLPLFD